LELSQLWKSCAHICDTCFYKTRSGGCQIGADSSKKPCCYWVISYHEFLRAGHQWPAEQITDYGIVARYYTLERNEIICEGFFKACCYTCKHRQPKTDCKANEDGICGRWEISLPFFMIGSNLFDRMNKEKEWN
jgi:hypothetical protein